MEASQTFIENGSPANKANEGVNNKMEDTDTGMMRFDDKCLGHNCVIKLLKQHSEIMTNGACGFHRWERDSLERFFRSADWETTTRPYPYTNRKYKIKAQKLSHNMYLFCITKQETTE